MRVGVRAGGKAYGCADCACCVTAGFHSTSKAFLEILLFPFG